MADKVATNPTPKQALLLSKAAVSAHRELMQNPSLLVSIECAQAQFVRLLTDQRTSDGNIAAQNFFKLEGMHQFIDILKNLAETISLPTSNKPPSIDHKA